MNQGTTQISPWGLAKRLLIIGTISAGVALGGAINIAVTVVLLACLHCNLVATASAGMIDAILILAQLWLFIRQQEEPQISPAAEVPVLIVRFVFSTLMTAFILPLLVQGVIIGVIDSIRDARKRGIPQNQPQYADEPIYSVSASMERVGLSYSASSFTGHLLGHESRHTHVQ